MTKENMIALSLLGTFFLYRLIKNQLMKKKIPQLMKNGAVIIDVRTPAEFNFGHNEKSINIPLDQFKIEISKKINDKNKTYILCCASGARSANAMMIMKACGYNHVINAGRWKNTLA